MMLDILVSFLAAALAGMGVGGGGLLVIYLTLVAGHPQPEAQGINLLFFLCAAGASLLVNRKKRHIDRKNVALTLLGGVGMALVGAWVAMNMNVNLLQKGFGVLLIVAGVVTLFRKNNRAV